eukprot:4075743-Alexandrium_andersonii.AAC.1
MSTSTPAVGASSTGRVVNLAKVGDVDVLGILMAPRGASSPANSVTAGVAGEWRQVQSKGTARRLKQPQ